MPAPQFIEPTTGSALAQAAIPGPVQIAISLRVNGIIALAARE